MFFCFLFLFFILASPISIPPDSKPSKNLYKKITETTGISLREIYKVVFNGDRTGQHRISKYVKVEGIRNLKSDIQKEMKTQEENCKRKPSEVCFRHLKVLEEEFSFIKGLEKQKSNSKFKLYNDLLIMVYHIRSKVLKEPYRAWEKQCMDQNRINTPKCKNQYFEIRVLHSIGTDLSEAARLKATNKKYRKKKGELDYLIKRYEETDK